MSDQRLPLEEKIVQAAETLLNDVGDGFTMEQLEARAEVSRATIYRRVGSKRALLERLVRDQGVEREASTDVRTRVLAAARTVFGRRGLVAATMEQIAEEAGVGVATVYRHFGDKDGLTRAFIDETTPRTTVRAVALHPTDDVEADLLTIVGATLRFFFDNRDLLRLVFMGSDTERRYLESLRERSDSTLGRLTDYFEAQRSSGRVKGDGEAAEMALALLGMVLAFAVIGPLHYATDLERPQRVSRLIVTLFLNDLRGEAT